MLRMFAIVAPLAASCLPASASEDVIVDGKHCNAFCQSWLGISTAPHVRDAARPPDPAPRVQDAARRPDPALRVQDGARPDPAPRVEHVLPPEALVPGEMPRESSAADDVGIPRPEALVAVRGGDIMVATPAEEAMRKRQLAALRKEIDKSAARSGVLTDRRK